MQAGSAGRGRAGGSRLAGVAGVTHGLGVPGLLRAAAGWWGGLCAGSPPLRGEVGVLGSNGG